VTVLDEMEAERLDERGLPDPGAPEIPIRIAPPCAGAPR